MEVRIVHLALDRCIFPRALGVKGSFTGETKDERLPVAARAVLRTDFFRMYSNNPHTLAAFKKIMYQEAKNLLQVLRKVMENAVKRLKISFSFNKKYKV